MSHIHYMLQHGDNMMIMPSSNEPRLSRTLRGWPARCLKNHRMCMNVCHQINAQDVPIRMWHLKASVASPREGSKQQLQHCADQAPVLPLIRTPKQCGQKSNVREPAIVKESSHGGSSLWCRLGTPVQPKTYGTNLKSDRKDGH
jgi:hypothetical protein